MDKCFQMCFPKCKDCEHKLNAYYDEEDGSVNQDNSNAEMFINESIHEHVDSVYVNFDVESPDCILAFIYEAGNEVFIVWTSVEAMELCNEPFVDFDY